jgi:ribosomal protein S18 acetylase RimI-like enzyme
MPPGAEFVSWRDQPEPVDIARVRQLVVETGVFSDEEARVAAELVETTLSGAETYQFLFADDGDALAGYTCFDRIPLSAVSFDLYWIVVKPGLARSGLGRELLHRTANLVRAQGGLQIFAETSSRPPYAPARAFYARCGFTEAARLADFYDRGDDKLVYRLRLG